MITRNDSPGSKLQFLQYVMLIVLTAITLFLLSRKHNLILDLHHRVNEISFLIISLSIAFFLGLWLIPYSTDLMTHSAAGLTETFLGAKQRTLVINSTTNLPELFLMFISLALGRLGGVATPLGSNFANLYLMFAVAPLIVLAKWFVCAQKSRLMIFWQLLKQEKQLLFWHLVLSLTLFMFSSLACWSITGVFPFVTLPENTSLRKDSFLILGGFICLLGVVLYFFFERNLQQQRPEIFEDIDDEDFDPSWLKFFLGTVGVILACYILNLFFLACSQIYAPFLKSFFGTATFAYIHYFIGSLISSLPETTVAVENYERLTASDLNTALSSATVSNMSNLAIAFLGSLCASLFVFLGFISQL